MIVWALFDSGNGCYKRSADEFEEIEIYSIGLDIENKNHHFINLNLADYSRMFGNNLMFETLDKGTVNLFDFTEKVLAEIGGEDD